MEGPVNVILIPLLLTRKGSSIKDVRKEGEGGQGKKGTCGHRGGGSSKGGRPHLVENRVWNCIE